MNLWHRWYCASGLWASQLQSTVAPWVLDGVDLGHRALELGPGPGLTTDLLRERVPELVSAELDGRLAGALGARLAGTRVQVVRTDASRLGLAAESFTGAVAFTMFHHVPSPVLQDRLFAEVARVLRPGGTFAGYDSTDDLLFRLFHLGDTGVPIDPETLVSRLGRAGFAHIEVDTVRGNLRVRGAFRFRARRP